MASAGTRSFLDALDEPALVIDRGNVRYANAAARTLLGAGIEGNDVRLAIRHPFSPVVIRSATRSGLPGTCSKW